MIEIKNKQLCESCFAETDSDICPKCGFNKSEYVSDPLVLPMGTRLGENIVIGRVMGKGGFGVTYLGYDLRMNRTIAVKEYYPNGIAYRSPAGTEVSLADTKSAEVFDSGAEKFYAEAEMVAQFNGNPNIVSVYDYFRENNTVYLVMEYISGITLKSYVKKHGRLTDGQALFVMDKIAAALSITHSAGVLHRDISPDNIMICMDGKIKLIDFGAARQIMAESSSNLTVVMKPGYTPVEQYTKKGRQGAWTDIYSLGASVYYALTEVIIDDPYARMEDDSELEENKHGINGDLWAILKKCTMINFPDRYGSAIDLRKALKSVSAPIKPEPIALDEDDLKIEETAVVPDIIPENVSEENVLTVTAASDNDGDTAEAIEVFEESTAAANVEDTAVTVKIPNKKKINKAIMAVSCTAAAVIIGIIGILLAGNKPADEDIFTAGSVGTSAAAVTENSETTKKDSSERKDSTTAKPPATDTTATTVPEREEKAATAATTAKPETTAAATTAAKPKTTTAATTTAKSQTTTAATTAAKPKTTTAPPATTTKVTTTTAAEPEKIEKPLYIPLSTKYPGRWGVDEVNAIWKSSLKYFTGDIKVVLDIECVNADKNDEGGYWRGITVRDGNWNILNVYAVNTGRSPWNGYNIYDGQTKLTFTVKRTDIDKANTKFMFEVENVIVKGATIYDFDPKEDEINPKAKIIQLDSEYPGTWNWSKSIPKEELESFKGDVKVTLSIEAVKGDGESAQVDDKNITVYWVNMDCITFDASTFDNKKVAVKADNLIIFGDEPYNLGTNSIPDKFTFVISSSEISKLYDGGLAFGCRNVIVKSAALEKA